MGMVLLFGSAALIVVRTSPLCLYNDDSRTDLRSCCVVSLVKTTERSGGRGHSCVGLRHRDWRFLSAFGVPDVQIIPSQRCLDHGQLWGGWFVHGNYGGMLGNLLSWTMPDEEGIHSAWWYAHEQADV